MHSQVSQLSWFSLTVPAPNINLTTCKILIGLHVISTFCHISLPPLCVGVCPPPELKEAVEDVLPSLMEQGVTVLLMTTHCDTPGIESFSDKVEEAPDEPLPRSLRSHITFKSPAVYIYTSGTTGTWVAVCWLFTFSHKPPSVFIR